MWVSPGTVSDHRQALLDLARIATSEGTVDDVMQRIAMTAKALIPAVDEASVTFTRGDDSGWTVASTGDLALALDEAQYAAGGGPCVDAASAGEALVVSDFLREQRWPRYVERARRTEGRSSLSVPIPAQAAALAALNLYAVEPDAFGPDDEALAEEIASFAAVAVANTKHYEDATSRAAHLGEAMRSRAVIEQAKGVLMATTGCDAEAAFELLRTQSQTENRKLREIAAELVAQQGRT